MSYVYVFIVGLALGCVIGILLGRKNRRKAELLAKASAVVGDKAQRVAKMAFDSVKEK